MTSPIPHHFTADGVLEPGDYHATFEELRGSLLVHGDGSSPTWDRAWRTSLVDNLAVLVEQLWAVGIEQIFVDGSFAEDKDHPNDIDGYFVCSLRDLATGDLVRKLNLLDPHKAWTWDPHQRRSAPGSVKKQLPMWLTYRVELYPHVGQLTGIRDRHGHDLEFPSAFRQSRRDGRPKGIVAIRRSTP